MDSRGSRRQAGKIMIDSLGSEAFTRVGRPEYSAGFRKNLSELDRRSGLEGPDNQWPCHHFCCRDILFHIPSQVTSMVVWGLASSKMLLLGRVSILYLYGLLLYSTLECHMYYIVFW